MGRASHQEFMAKLHDPKPELTMREVGDLVDELMKWQYAEAWDDIDRLMCEATPLTMCPDAIVVLARVPFLSRARLPNWRPFVDRAAAALTEQGRDATAILEGLLDRTRDLRACSNSTP
jgi:hypothetical protein